MKKRILSIGNCGFDHGNLGKMLHQHFQVDLEAVDTAPEAVEKLKQQRYDLVMVNRVFDSNGDSGLKLIQHLKKDHALQAVPIMLISNYDYAQEEARSLGAEPGFGKNQLGKPHVVDLLKPYLQA